MNPPIATDSATRRAEAVQHLEAQGFHVLSKCVASLLTPEEAAERATTATTKASAALLTAATRILRDRPYAEARELIEEIEALAPVKGGEA